MFILTLQDLQHYLLSLRSQNQYTVFVLFKSHIPLVYLGPISVILCIAKVTLFSSLSWLLWCTEPFFTWCPLPWIKRKQNHTSASSIMKSITL